MHDSSGLGALGSNVVNSGTKFEAKFVNRKTAGNVIGRRQCKYEIADSDDRFSLLKVEPTWEECLPLNTKIYRADTSENKSDIPEMRAVSCKSKAHGHHFERKVPYSRNVSRKCQSQLVTNTWEHFSMSTNGATQNDETRDSVIVESTSNPWINGQPTLLSHYANIQTIWTRTLLFWNRA